MVSLSLSTAGQTCIPSSGIIKRVLVPCYFYRNNIISVRQTYPLRVCRTGRNIPEDAANGAHKLRNLKVSEASHNSIEQIQPGMGLNYSAETLQRGFSYLFRTELGGIVKVLVGVNNMKYAVHIEVSSLPHYLNIHDLILSWGMFRSDSSQLYALDSQTSLLDTSQSMSQIGHGSIKTPFAQNSLGTYTIMLEFDSTQIPFYLSFLLHSDSSSVETDSGIRTHRKTNFCVPVGLSAGHPMPLGVSKSEDGSVNFAVFSRNAESVVLCLYDSNANQPCLEIELDPYVNPTGDIWHVSMESCGDYFSYGYRCKGEIIWDKGSRFHALLDPYAKLIGNFFPDEGESVSLVKCLGFLSEEPTFDWSGDVHPRLPMEELVVYRLNVGNFTKDETSALPENVAGTFAGVIEKLQHFISLGVNAVLLEAIFSFDEQKGPYFPYHFFSPMNSYGCKCDGMTSVNSLKEMVKTLHAHGIEVLLEVVFTHSSEGGDAACQTISFRGVDNSSYYIIERDMGSGINNAVNCNNPIVQKLILESLCYWLTEFHIDGFCFIYSSYLLRGSNGDHLSRPPLVEAIAFDPLLSKTKIIADSWSPIDMLYVDIHFPHWKRWAEINARFCRDVRNFLRGEGLLSDLATRLCGSGDLFSGINTFSHTPPKEWFQTSAVLRVSLGNFLFFITFALMMIGVKDQNDKRDSLHHGGWIAKIVIWAVLIVLMFFLPNEIITIYETLSKFGSGFFLLVQVIILLDFTHTWNDSWVEKDEQKWYIALLSISIACYLAAFVFSGVLFLWFNPSGHDCSLNVFFIVMTMILAFAFAVIALHPLVNGSLLPASVISVYCAYLCYSGLSSEPRDYACNGLHKHSKQVSTGTLVLGMLTTVLSVVYSAVRAGSSMTFLSPPSSPKSGSRKPLLEEGELESGKEEKKESEPKPVSYSYTFFHLIFALASMYSAMLLTGWTSSASDSSELIDVGWTSTWVRICTEWATAALYIWTLLAPLILPNREFS